MFNHTPRTTLVDRTLRQNYLTEWATTSATVRCLPYPELVFAPEQARVEFGINAGGNGGAVDHSEACLPHLR